MIEDTLLQYQLRKLDDEIEKKRGELETCLLEDVRFLQGEVAAFKATRIALEEQYQNWMRGEEDRTPRSTNLERMLDLVPADDEP